MNTTLPPPSSAYSTDSLPSSSNGGGDGGSGNLPRQISAPATAAAAITPIASGDDSEAAALMTSAEVKAAAACRSHKEAERLRRKRINGHLSTLRTLLPNLLKTDKASLLGEVVRRVRELKQATSQMTTPSASIDGDGAREERLFPEETDVVRVRRCDGNGAGGVVIATLSCEDRPELLSDLSRALKSVRAKVVRAEIATVGGRTKCVLWLQDGGDWGGREGLAALSRALKAVVDRPNCSTFVPGLGLFGPKRQRLCR